MMGFVCLFVQQNSKEVYGMKIIFAPTKLFNEQAEQTNEGTMFDAHTNKIVNEITVFKINTDMA